ncbi:MAG TPA: PilZ domain-containing protein [Turneriella sp.]|nr:PilZ domain-containing protein [Turneriella sp.]
MSIAQQASLPPDERRAHPRYKYVKPMRVIVARRPIEGFTCDIGQGGLSFIVDSVLAPGLVTVELPGAKLSFEGRVTGNQAAEAGFFRHHMQFKDLVGTAVLEQLLS